MRYSVNGHAIPVGAATEGWQAMIRVVLVDDHQRVRCGIRRLSRRGVQVMLMVTAGHRLPDISDRLCLSPKTVSSYRYRLYDKLGVSNDVEPTRRAIRHGLLDRAP